MRRRRGRDLHLPRQRRGGPRATTAEAPLEVSLYLPQDLTFGPDEQPYVLDWNNHRVRTIARRHGRDRDRHRLARRRDGRPGARGLAQPPDARAVRRRGRGCCCRPGTTRKVMRFDPETDELDDAVRRRQARLRRRRRAGGDGRARPAGRDRVRQPGPAADHGSGEPAHPPRRRRRHHRHRGRAEQGARAGAQRASRACAATNHDGRRRDLQAVHGETEQRRPDVRARASRRASRATTAPASKR